MAGRGRTTPTKNGANTTCLSSLAKHEKTPQLPPLQTKIFRVSRFAIFFFIFPGPPLLEGGACRVQSCLNQMLRAGNNEGSSR